MTRMMCGFAFSAWENRPKTRRRQTRIGAFMELVRERGK
jgi:hypothetical protein